MTIFKGSAKRNCFHTRLMLDSQKLQSPALRPKCKIFVLQKRCRVITQESKSQYDTVLYLKRKKLWLYWYWNLFSKPKRQSQVTNILILMMNHLAITVINVIKISVSFFYCAALFYTKKKIALWVYIFHLFMHELCLQTLKARLYAHAII